MEQVFKEARRRKDPTELLVHLTKITSLINASLSQEDVAFYNMEHDVQWLMGLLDSKNTHVGHASSKALLASSNYLQNHQPAQRTWFLSALWKNVKDADKQGLALTLLLLRNIAKGSSDKKFVYDNIPVIATTILHKDEIVLGAALKLLCTSFRDLEDVHREYPMFFEVQGLLQTVCKRALGPSSCNVLPRFIRYKCLVFLLRLSRLENPVLSWCCLRELSSAGSDLLELKLPKEPAAASSPFLSDTVPHLQRRSLLVLFTTVKTVVAAGDFKEAASEVFFKWLTFQMETLEDMSNLIISLVNLFTEEDDLLLEMLMVLLDFKLDSSVKHHSDFVAEISPLRLFHHFLAAICYDHSVIIDLLISKNTGLVCLQYLLKSLRFLCDNWHAFANATRDETSNLKKKQKRSASKPHFELARAKEFLAELESTMTRLQNKGLFPYNAWPLIDRCKLARQLLL